MTFRKAVEALIQRAAFRLLGIDRLVAFVKALPPYTPLTGTAVMIEAMKIKVLWSGLPADALPEAGRRLIVVANHPFGLVEALALDAFLLTRRKDVTFIAWHFIGELPGIEGRYILVDPLRNPQHRKLNIDGWRRAFQWLAEGGAIGVFPAGKVARLDWRRGAVVDPPWNPHIARLARKMQASVLPVYFHGRNSLVFQLAALAMPTLHQSLVIREVNNKRGFTLRATVGGLIQPEELAGFATDQEAIDFLRRRTEALAGA